MNRRVVGVVAAILLAAVGTWILVQYVSTADERAAEDQVLVEVLVVDAAIPQGTPVVEAANSISNRAVRDVDRVPSALASLDSVRGLVTAVDLLPGEQVLASRFVEEEVLLAADRTVEVPDGLLELTVQLTTDRAVGATLIAGDLVAVLSSFEPFTLDAIEPADEQDLNNFLNNDGNVEPIALTTPNSTGISAHKALVTRVQLTAAPAVDEAGNRNPDVAPDGGVLVTLAVPPGDAEQIVFTAEFGAIWLARESATTPEADPVLIITRANVYR